MPCKGLVAQCEDALHVTNGGSRMPPVVGCMPARAVDGIRLCTTPSYNPRPTTSHDYRRRVTSCMWDVMRSANALDCLGVRNHHYISQEGDPIFQCDEATRSECRGNQDAKGESMHRGVETGFGVDVWENTPVGLPNTRPRRDQDETKTCFQTDQNAWTVPNLT